MHNAISDNRLSVLFDKYYDRNIRGPYVIEEYSCWGARLLAGFIRHEYGHICVVLHDVDILVDMDDWRIWVGAA